MGKRVRASVTIREDDIEPRRRRGKKNSNAFVVAIVVLVLLALVWSRQQHASRGGIPQGVTAPR